MKDKLVSTGVLLGIGLNILIIICMYLLEYRVGLLEGQHEEKVCKMHYHE